MKNFIHSEVVNITIFILGLPVVDVTPPCVWLVGSVCLEFLLVCFFCFLWVCAFMIESCQVKWRGGGVGGREPGGRIKDERGKESRRKNGAW